MKNVSKDSISDVKRSFDAAGSKQHKGGKTLDFKLEKAPQSSSKFGNASHCADGTVYGSAIENK